MADAQEAPQREKIDWSDPIVLFALIAAFIGDVLTVLILPHYIVGAVVIAILWGRSRGFFAKLILAVALLIPFPFFLLAGACAAIALTNSKILSTVVEQAGIAVVTVVTGGAGGVLEVGAIAGEGAVVATEAGVAVTEVAAGTAEAAVAGAGVAGGVAEGVGATVGAAEGAGQAAESVGREAAEEVEEGFGDRVRQKAKDWAKKKIRERIEKGLAGPDEDENREPTEDEIAAAIADMKKEEELNKALGEQPEVMSDVQGKLLGEAPLGDGGRGGDGVGPFAHVVSSQPPRPPQNGNAMDNVVSGDAFSKRRASMGQLSDKEAETQRQRELARQPEDDGKDSSDVGIGKAA